MRGLILKIKTLTCPRIILLVATSITQTPKIRSAFWLARVRLLSVIAIKYKASGFADSNSPSVKVPFVTIAHISRFTTYKQWEKCEQNLIFFSPSLLAKFTRKILRQNGRVGNHCLKTKKIHK